MVSLSTDLHEKGQPSGLSSCPAVLLSFCVCGSSQLLCRCTKALHTSTLPVVLPVCPCPCLSLSQGWHTTCQQQ